MNVLERARKVYEQAKEQRNGHSPFASDSPRGCEKSEKSEKSPCLDDVAPPCVSIQPCEKSEISEKSSGVAEPAEEWLLLNGRWYRHGYVGLTTPWD
jgi:hypothetical protein